MDSFKGKGIRRGARGRVFERDLRTCGGRGAKERFILLIVVDSRMCSSSNLSNCKL